MAMAGGPTSLQRRVGRRFGGLLEATPVAIIPVGLAFIRPKSQIIEQVRVQQRCLYSHN
jgi:hypothetical protein